MDWLSSQTFDAVLMRNIHTPKSQTPFVVVMPFAWGPSGEAGDAVTYSQTSSNCMFSITLGIVLAGEGTRQTTTAVTP